MRAFLVLGPESSGTKLLTEILIKAGCAGDAGNVQRWDTESPSGDPIVLRRSVPHGEKYPDIVGIIGRLRTLGYQIFAYVTTRDWTAILSSRVIIAGLLNFEIASQRIQWAYPHIFSALASHKVPFAMVSYEAVTEYKEAYIARMLKIFGLDCGEFPEIYHGNEKHYQDEFLTEGLANACVQRPVWL